MALPSAPPTPAFDARTAFLPPESVVATSPWFDLPVARIAPPAPPAAAWLVALAPYLSAWLVWAARPVPPVLSMKPPTPLPTLFIWSAMPDELVLTVVFDTPASFGTPKTSGSPAAARVGVTLSTDAAAQAARPPSAPTSKARRDRDRDSG
jgi:hypothetical protein